MPRRPDFHQLVHGVLYFPADAVEEDPRLQFADAGTWATWATIGRAELWQLVALANHLDPKHLPWRELQGPQTSVAGLFNQRLDEAVEALLMLSLEPAQSGTPLGPETVVRVAEFAHWAKRTAIFLPALFPTGESVAIAPTPARAPRERKSAPDKAWVRQAELLTMVPFSAATLWRKVKDRTFVAPHKLSSNVTAWRRDEVTAWLAQAERPRAKRSGAKG